MKRAALAALFVGGGTLAFAGCVVWAAFDVAKHGLVRGQRGRR